MNIYPYFDNLLDNYIKKIYQFCFLLAPNPDDSRKNAFQSFLYVATLKREIKDEDEQEEILKSAIRTSEDYYLTKMHRKPKRDDLQKNLRFHISDSLWQILSLSFREKIVLYLSFSEEYDVNQISTILKLRPARIEHLISNSPLTKEDFTEALESIFISEEAISLFKDDIYYRFEKRSVGFENKLLNFRSFMDRAILWIALAIIILFVAAILYTARL